MLTGYQINKIVTALKRDGYFPEIKKSEELVEEIKKDYLDLVYSSLTEDEKKAIEVLPKDAIKNNPKIDITSIVNPDNFDEKYCLRHYYFNGKSDFYDYYSLDVSNNGAIVVPDGKAIKINIGDLWKKIRDFIKIRNSYYKKVELIEKVLRYPGTNMTTLKTYYPQLYKYLKEK